MQNFTINPTQSLTKTATFVHSDQTPDVGFGSNITWSCDRTDLLQLSFGGQGAPQFNVQLTMTPVQPAASQLTGPTVVTVTGQFVNENGATISSPFTVTIAPNANPATGLVMQ